MNDDIKKVLETIDSFIGTINGAIKAAYCYEQEEILYAQREILELLKTKIIELGEQAK